MNPVHPAAACYAQDCHHHAPPLMERDTPAPANPETTHQLHHGGHVTGPVRFIPYRRDLDEQAMTAAEAQAATPDLHYWRPEPDECEHGATVTSHAAIWTYNAHGDIDITATTTERVTLCLDCHTLTATQEDAQ